MQKATMKKPRVNPSLRGVNEQATSVLKQMLGAYERSGAQAAKVSPKKATFEVNVAAGKLYEPK